MCMFDGLLLCVAAIALCPARQQNYRTVPVAEQSPEESDSHLHTEGAAEHPGGSVEFVQKNRKFRTPKKGEKKDRDT